MNIIKTTPIPQQNLQITPGEQAFWANAQQFPGQHNLQNFQNAQAFPLINSGENPGQEAFFIPSLVPQQNISGASRIFQLEPEKALESEIARFGQINDASVRRFRSGEEILFDFDYDKSKKDLEDFIFRTQNAIKNQTYVESKLKNNGNNPNRNSGL